MRLVLVTGTGTDVGKTVATAALAARLSGWGSVGICKPVQTGLEPGEPGDVDDAARLAGVSRIAEFFRYPEPLAPETAAARAGMTTPSAPEMAARIADFARGADVTLVEGAGGVLVRLGDGVTLLDVARELRSGGHDVEFVVVARAGLGTLSDTELTVDRIRGAGLAVAGIVVGAYPDEPDLATRCNVADLPRLTRCAVLGVVREGAGQLGPEEFRDASREWFPDASLAGLRPDRRLT